MCQTPEGRRAELEHSERGGTSSAQGWRAWRDSGLNSERLPGGLPMSSAGTGWGLVTVPLSGKAVHDLSVPQDLQAPSAPGCCLSQW